MLSQLRAWGDRLRSSLFFVPMLCVIGGVLLGEAMLVVDALVTGIDPRLTATVDSARTVLTTVAGATLTFAGIAFSVSLLLISLASSQYSPRVVHGMFRDPFNKRVMGLVIGTFTYCLVVLRAVRGALEDAGDAVVPSVSILLAVVLGIVSILSIVAFINHGAHSMDVSKILRRVTDEVLTQARSAWPEPEPESSGVEQGESPPLPEGAAAVRFATYGWVQNVDYDVLLSVLPPGATVRLDTFAGQYAIQHTPICHISPVPDDIADIAEAVRAAVMVGETRTLQQDMAYGVRQLSDVALKAMSPGINDPTTAHDAMSHLGTVLADLLSRQAPSRRLSGRDGLVLMVPHATTYEELVGIAFDEVRIASAEQPTVLIYLLDVLHHIEQSLAGLHRPSAALALRSQAELIRAMNETADVPEPDRERVRVAYARRYRDDFHPESGPTSDTARPVDLDGVG
ncbi:hypothetical protein GCM10009641_84740 [Mycobacterium cookii]|uniref:DUF2254 domain-containing protein n=1 Tax=Nocardioides furvisabuli TaxID=375542 RepID=A0ABN2WWW3_9ACTN|nr:DUF2254 domain-containing protein [Nocardioides furvisabuli]